MGFQWANLLKVLSAVIAVATVAGLWPGGASFLLGAFTTVATERFWPFFKK